MATRKVCAKEIWSSQAFCKGCIVFSYCSTSPCVLRYDQHATRIPHRITHRAYNASHIVHRARRVYIYATRPQSRTIKPHTTRNSPSRKTHSNTRAPSNHASHHAILQEKVTLSQDMIPRRIFLM